MFIIRSLSHEALEYQQSLDIENTWPEKLMYSITLPHKAWAAGDTLTAIVKLSPLAKGVYVQAIDSSISETTKILTRGGSRQDTRVVASVRHEIIEHQAVEVEVATPSSIAAAATGSPLETPRSSRPGSPHFGYSSSSSSYHHYHPPPQHYEQQEAEDLGLDSNDIVTYVNLSIPRYSAYPVLHSTSSGSSPTTTPPRSTSPLPSTNSAASHSTSPSHLITPSHNLEPILILHRIKWIIFIHNKDGHVSELRCSLPIKILDGALLEESREFTMRTRKLLLTSSGFGCVLGEAGNEGEGDEGAGVDREEGRIGHAEADRELPSYPAHVRDRVANMYLPDAVTMRVSNPWVGRIRAANGSGARTPSTTESSGQRESHILSPLMAVVSPSDPANADRSTTPHPQPESRASRSGRSTPAIQPSQQQVDTMSHLPPAPGESLPLDWVNSELLLSLSLNDEAVRRIGGVVSSVGGQQQQQQQQSQPQPSQHQHQSHSHSQQHQQQGRALRWGGRVDSRTGSRAASPERSALTTNNDNGPNSFHEGGSSSGSGFASPLQHLFKATMKPFTALAGHHGHGHGHRTIQPRSLSTPVTGNASGLGASVNNSSRPSTLHIDSTRTCSSYGADPISLSSLSPSLAPQEDTNGFITSSPSSQSLATNGTTSSSSSSSFFDPSLESASTSPSTSASPLPHTIAEPDSQEDPNSKIFRAFNLVPDYSIASRGFIGGGVPPLSSMRGLPSYEEAEAQRRQREAVHILRDDEEDEEEDERGKGENQ